MATRKLVPRADNEGGIGTALKQWASGWIKALTVTTINALTLAAASVGFTIAGGTTSKTLTVLDNVTVGGAAVNPTLPAFSVGKSGTQSNIAVGSLVTVTWETEIFDQAGNFAANVFTAPVTGKYQLNLLLVLSQVDSATTELQVRIITTNRSYFWIMDPRTLAADGVVMALMSCLADMDAAETAYIVVYQADGTQQMDLDANSRFSGYLAC